MAKLSRLGAKIVNILKKENAVAIMEAMGNVVTGKNAEFTKREMVIKEIKKQTNKAGTKIKITVCLIRWLYTGTAFGIATFNAYLKTAKAVKSFGKENAESRTFFEPARILIKHVRNILFNLLLDLFLFLSLFSSFSFFLPTLTKKCTEKFWRNLLLARFYRTFGIRSIFQGLKFLIE